MTITRRREPVVRNDHARRLAPEHNRALRGEMVEGRALWDMANELGDLLPPQTITEAERRELVSRMRARRFEEGEVVYHRGDPAGDLFVVYQGLVKSVLHDEQGRELVIGRSGRGEFFGGLGLFTTRPRESTAIAVVPTTCLEVPRADARFVLERNPRAMAFLVERLADAIAKLSDQVETMAFLDVRGRLARHLVELQGLGEVPVRQEDIAATIGASLSAVNHALADFERRGLVVVARQRVRVLDAAGLRREIRT